MKIGVVGCGSMGSALAIPLGEANELFLYDRNTYRCEELAEKTGGTPLLSLEKLLSSSDMLILAIRPDGLDELCHAMASKLAPHHWVVSVLAGVETEVLRTRLPGAGRWFYLMPNIAVRTGKGVLAFEAVEQHTLEVREQMEGLFGSLGGIYWIPSDKMSAVSVVAASSPAFVSVLLEAMLDAAVYLGLRADQALSLLLQVLEGSAALVRDEGTPTEVRRQVAAPGGTTAAGVRAFEKCGGRSAVIEMFLGTAERLKELGH